MRDKLKMGVGWRAAARPFDWPPSWPQGRLGWPLFIIAGVTAYWATLASLPNLLRWAALAALAALFLWRYRLPSIPKWPYFPWPIRAGIVALLGWFLMVSLGWIAGAGRDEAWGNLLAVRGVPWTPLHSAAACVCALLAHSQIYVMPRNNPVADAIVDQTIFERGAILQAQAEVERRARAALANGGPALIWGFMPMPLAIAPQNFLLIGAPQSGKTLTQLALMKSALDRIREPKSNARALVYDAKRDTYSHLAALGLAEKVHILNPFDIRGSAWDMAADLHGNPVLATEIAAILFPENNRDNPFFPQAARSLFEAVVMAFCSIAPRQWTLRDVVLCMRSPSRIRAVLADRRGGEFAHLIEVFLAQRDSNADVQGTVLATINQLTHVAAAWWHAWKDGRRVSLSNWAGSEEILLLGSNPELTSMMQRINAILFHRVTQILRNQCEADHEASFRLGGPRRQTWLFIDELANAGKLPELQTLLSEARSKGVCTVAAFQSLPQLEHAYPEGEAHALLASFGNRAFFTVHDLKTAEFMSKETGMAEVDEVRVTLNAGHQIGGNESTTSGEHPSSTRGTSWGENWGKGTQHTLRNRPAVMAEEIMKLPLAKPETGIIAVVRTKEFTHSYFMHASPHLVNTLKISPNFAVANFMDRPAEQKLIRDWDADDLKRLNLAGIVNLPGTRANSRPRHPLDFDEGEPALFAVADEAAGVTHSPRR